MENVASVISPENLLQLDLELLPHIDKRDLILAGIQTRHISEADVILFFTKMNQLAGLCCEVQPAPRRECDLELLCRKGSRHIIPSAFGDQSQSGALLRYSVNPDCLIFQHQRELTFFIKCNLLNTPERKRFTESFLLARQAQLISWIQIGQVFLGEPEKMGEEGGSNAPVLKRKKCEEQK